MGVTGIGAFGFRAKDREAADKQWTLSFRVEGLDELKATLESKGIAVVTNPDWDAPGVGRFVRTVDSEGNHIELWEPG
jgi:predicted enzyme related to lactoylglutathione lyase